VTQLVLPLHECVAKPPHAIADPAVAESTVVEPLHSAADPTAAESTAVEPLHYAADHAAAGAAMTKTSCLCV
jgi:hypothetical protein